LNPEGGEGRKADPEEGELSGRPAQEGDRTDKGIQTITQHNVK